MAQDPPSPLCLGRCLPVLPRGKQPPSTTPLPSFPSGLPAASAPGTWCRLGLRCPCRHLAEPPPPLPLRYVAVDLSPWGQDVGRNGVESKLPALSLAPRAASRLPAPKAPGLPSPTGAPESSPIPKCPGQMPERLKAPPCPSLTRSLTLPQATSPDTTLQGTAPQHRVPGALAVVDEAAPFHTP